MTRKYARSAETDRGPKNQSDAVDPETGVAHFADQKLGNAQDNPKLIHPEFEVSPSLDAEKKAKLDKLKFMNEMVTVDILAAGRDEDDEVFVIEVNENKCVFRRNERKTVPRYIVEGLARAKPIGYSNEEYYKPDGTRDIRWPTRRGERYPFAVFHDPNPDGARWLQQVRAQP